MKHRGIEYRIMQGVGRNLWLWSIDSDAAKVSSGTSRLRGAAIMAAERAIDGAFEPKGRTGPPPEKPQRTTLTTSGLRTGDRCSLSILGRTRCPRMVGRGGTVVGVDAGGSPVRVLFDGRKSPAVLHSTYVQFLAEEHLSAMAEETAEI